MANANSSSIDIIRDSDLYSKTDVWCFDGLDHKEL